MFSMDFFHVKGSARESLTAFPPHRSYWSIGSGVMEGTMGLDLLFKSADLSLCNLIMAIRPCWSRRMMVPTLTFAWSIHTVYHNRSKEGANDEDSFWNDG